MKKIIIFIIPIFLLIPLILAKPIYSVEGWIDKTNVNPNEKIELKISFMGEGNISYSRTKISTLDGDVFFIFKDNENSGSIIIPDYPSIGYFNNEFADGFSYAEAGVIQEEQGNHPILRMDVKSSQEGNHKLLINFLYMDEEGQSYLSERELEFHVNTWMERNEKWIIPIGIFISLLALFFGGAYNEEIKKGIKETFKKISKS
ncbi:MAG: hypothetical protein PHH00_01175 [Candidatus Nanoarchaeia archaeon]|nr:hypothetical protein [Candidatus Nanoarchaeia archaeon]